MGKFEGGELDSSASESQENFAEKHRGWVAEQVQSWALAHPDAAKKVALAAMAADAVVGVTAGVMGELNVNVPDANVMQGVGLITALATIGAGLVVLKKIFEKLGLKSPLDYLDTERAPENA